MKQMLLLSNSMSFNGEFLEHCESGINNFLTDINEVLIIPYAKKDYDAYFEHIEPFFKNKNKKLISIHKSDPVEAINAAKAIYIPGGNTFRLLNELYKNDILALIKEKVEDGVRYIGSSAGSNLACPTIMTTNDMPIIYPKSLDALGLIDFQINCHYLDKDPNFPHNGESREDRIREYLEFNNSPVVGLREDTWLECNDDQTFLKGKDSAVLFRKGKVREEIKPNSSIKL